MSKEIKVIITVVIGFALGMTLGPLGIFLAVILGLAVNGKGDHE